MKKNRYYEIELKPPEIEIVNTATSKYLLPAAGMSLNNLRMVTSKTSYNSMDILNLIGYKSSYSYFPKLEKKYENEIYLLLIPSKYALSAYFHSFYEYISSLPSFLDIISIDIRTFVVVLQLDKRWDGINPKNLVMRGNFSKLGAGYVNRYFKDTEDAYRVIMKETGKKKLLEAIIGQELDDWQELESKPDIKMESLDLKIKWDLEYE